MMKKIPMPIAYTARAALMAVAMFSLLSGAADAKEGKAPQTLQTLQFGVDASYPPFESKAADGSLKGFDIDLGNALCAQMQVKCGWVELSLDSLIQALQAKKFDAILSSFSVTKERSEQIAFTDKLYDAPARLVAPKGSGLMPTVESLKGRRVGVEQGSTEEAYAKAYWQNHGVTVVSYPDQQQVYSDLKNGRLDAVFQDAVQADVGFLKTPSGNGYSFAGPLINDPKTIGNGTAIGLRKEDTALKEKLNAALARLHQDGQFKRLEEKYFSFSIYSGDR